MSTKKEPTHDPEQKVSEQKQKNKDKDAINPETGCPYWLEELAG